MDPEKRPTYRIGLLAGELILGISRRVYRVLPAAARTGLESRFFGTVFQTTRVTNDAYGWRPDAPGGGEPPPGYQLPPQPSPPDPEKR